MLENVFPPKLRAAERSEILTQNCDGIAGLDSGTESGRLHTSSRLLFLPKALTCVMLACGKELSERGAAARCRPPMFPYCAINRTHPDTELFDLKKESLWATLFFSEKQI